MRKKSIVILLVCMLVVPSIIVSGEKIESKKASSEEALDGPIWKVGHSWTYTVDNFWVNTTYQGNKVKMVGKIDDFKWIVTDVTDTTYVVSLSGDISAGYEVKTVLGNIILEFNGGIEPSSSRIKGTIIFDKTNLHIIDLDAQIICLSAVQFYNLPLRIPLVLKITADPSLSTPFPLLDFPLSTLKFWNLPEMDIDTDIRMGGILGIIGAEMTVHKHYDWTPLAFCCLVQSSITVEGGTYDAWRILSLIGGVYDYYYAPIVGNLIKFEFDLPSGGATGELKGYEFSIKDRNVKST